jgi:C4-dicarboxylate-specific signal transduction histidine kinase
VELEVTLSHFWVVLSVPDSVPGIAPEKAGTYHGVFFFTPKTVGKGTGPGLSISRSIALEHLGTLELNPESPHTCSVLKLPLGGA